MEGATKGEKDEKEPQLLRIDPKCLQDALRGFFPPIKTDDPRLDFYTMYKREATEYDTNYVRKYDEDLNTTLIFAGLFSAVSSAFVIDVHSKLETDPNDQTAVLLRAILLTLNQSAIPGETPVVPPVRGGPSSEIVTVTGLMYASLLISLLAAFIAMLGKQWLNRYLRHSGGSMIERCGDRQRKCDGLKTWPLHFFVEGLPVMLQISLLLLACALCKHIASINGAVAGVLISLTVLGATFYLGIVIAGTYSYDCPFQTPASTGLRRLWTKTGSYLLPPLLPVIATLRNLREISRRRISHIVTFLSHIDIRNRFRGLLERIQLGILHVGLRLPRTGFTIRLRLRHTPLPIALEGLHSPTPVPWLTLKDLATVRVMSINDARCVSWILWNITDPEALDAAIRLAGTIRWFEDGVDVEPPYGQIVSIFRTCFGSNGEVYPGSRDRAYYSGQAILWIHTLSMCKSQELSSRFPLPTTRYSAPAADHDLTHLLNINTASSTDFHFIYLLSIDARHSPSHSQWISNVLLHRSWANQTTLDFNLIQRQISKTGTSVPLNAMLNHLLTWCNFLGLPVKEETLKVQDKSDRLEWILYRLSKAIISAINANSLQCKLILHVLNDLTKVKVQPPSLTTMAYRWCSVIGRNHQHLEDWEDLLLLSLEIGFRHLDPEIPWISARLSHTVYHQKLVDVVFKHEDREAIADLLHAWTLRESPHDRLDASLSMCASHLVGLNCLVPFSTRLRRLVIRSIEAIGHQGFKEVEAEAIIRLLNHLDVGTEDMQYKLKWIQLLLHTIQSSKEPQHLSYQSWEFLIEHLILEGWRLEQVTYKPHVASSLEKAQKWDMLECWMGIVWMMWPPEADSVETVEKLRQTTLLYQQQPNAAKKLEQWMKQWSQEWGLEIPEYFQQACEQVHEIAHIIVQ